MRIIKLNEVFEAVCGVKPASNAMAGVVTLSFDPFAWVLLWKVWKLDEVDFDCVKVVECPNPITAQAFLGLANKLKLTLTIVQTELSENDKCLKTHKFKFERGFLVRYEVKHGKSVSWETREYNDLGQMIIRCQSTGIKQSYSYDVNGKLIDVACDKKTREEIEKKTRAELSEDGTILEVSC